MEPKNSAVSLWLDRAIPTHSDPFEPGAHHDAIVVGAGITGLATAVMLARGGLKVAVVEARSVGAVATGNTTAKLSLLHGTVLTGIRHHFPERVVRAYVDGNRAGQDWLLQELADRGVAVQHRDAYTYATTDAGEEQLRQERTVAREAGLPVEHVDELELPYATRGGLLLREQAQFDPVEVLSALVREIRALGGVVIEGQRVTDVSAARPAEVTTPGGTVTADHVILATGIPILDRGLYFAKLEPHRSYAAAYRVPGAPESIPAGMYLSVDAPVRSLRTAPVDGEELLIVGGNDHVVGRVASTAREVAELDAWARKHFPGAEPSHRWSAQDYRSANMTPFVGWLPRGRGRIFLATGYNKWGMTNSAAAALSLSADILGTQEDLPWAKVLHHRITSPSDLAAGAKANAAVAAELAKGQVEARITGPRLDPDTEHPAEGTGIVGHHARHAVAVSTVDGMTCAVSAVCTHLGGIVTWNDAERSWDCPLHGSRFSSDGTLLEGPATEDLAAAGTGVENADAGGTDVGGAQ